MSLSTVIGLLIIKSIYFFLPAYFANMAPVFARKIPFLNKSIWEKKLGKNKTWRGLVVGIMVGLVIFWLQKVAYTLGFTSLAMIDYGDYSILLGALLGGGAIVGDLVESYYKRKGEIPPGEPWIPFDQLDFVIGAIVFSFIMYVPPAEVMLILVIVSPLLHLLINYIGFLLGIRSKKV